jgi:hypothetical protein
MSERLSKLSHARFQTAPAEEFGLLLPLYPAMPIAKMDASTSIDEYQNITKITQIFSLTHCNKF